MDARVHRRTFSGTRALVALLVATAAMLALALGLTTARAAAEPTPEKTDVTFIFDTSGSMGGELGEAKENILKVMEEISHSLPNVEYGVSNVEDIPGYYEGHFSKYNEEGEPTEEQESEKEYEESNEKAWRLDQPLTSETSKAVEAIDALTIGGGGDGPEAYARALWETNTNPNVGWREGARHEIVLIADNVPHNVNLNEGMPPEFQLTEPGTDGFETWPNTGEEPGGKFGIPGTQWAPGTNLGIQAVADQLGEDGKPLESVEFYGSESGFLPYWEHWAYLSGGQALDGGNGELASKLTTAILTGATKSYAPCPSGKERSATSGICSTPVKPAPAPTPISGIHLVASSPPVKGKVYVLEDGEIEEEDEFPEDGEAEFSGEIGGGEASFARFQGGALELVDNNQQLAFTAKAKKCKKGFVRKKGKCVSTKPIPYGHEHLSVTKAGKYKLRVKPSTKAMKALKRGKTLHVKLTLVFTPAETTDHIRSTRTVTVHLKKKHKKKKK